MRVLQVIFAGLLAAASHMAWAWGAQGHRLVGSVADLDLTPRTRIAVTQLMGGNDSLSSVSTWMDEVRSDQRFAYLKPWHFVNINVCHPKAVPCPSGNCAPERIKWAIGELKSHDAQRQDMGLKVLVHLVGDIHQPLHAADNDDLGGNKVMVTNRRCARDGCELHSYWDTYLVKRAVRGVKFAQVPQALHDAFSALPARDRDDPYAWAQESEALAKSVAYNFSGFACGQVTDVTLDPAYDEQAVEVVRSQIAKAGKRLARILNEIFDGSK